MMRIRRGTVSDIEQLEIMMNTIIKVLIEKGIKQWDYPCERKLLEEEIKYGFIFICENNNEVVGCFSIREVNYIERINVKEASFYLYRVMIHSKYHGRKWGDHIINYVRSFFSINKDVYLDCWFGNFKLRNFYLRNHCSYLGDFLEDDYMVSFFKV